MQAFAERSTEHGHPVGGGFTAIERLMNLLLLERDFEEHAAEMIRAGRQSLLRLINDESPTRNCEEVAYWPRVLFDRRDRVRAAQTLATTRPTLEPSQSWELWTGAAWISLQQHHNPTDSAHAARIAELRQARTAWQTTEDDHLFMHSHGPIADGRYVSDRKGHSDSYLLADAPGSVDTWRWCRCKTGPRTRLVHIEHWEGHDGLVGSGWAHASCRRLIRMD